MLTGNFFALCDLCVLSLGKLVVLVRLSVPV